MKQIILASASPRRSELLKQLGLDFDIIPSCGEEIVTKTDPEEVVKELAVQKASEVRDHILRRTYGQAGAELSKESGAQFPTLRIIGADTVVVYNGEIFGKPADEADAKRMLTILQGKTHQVYTGVCVITLNEKGAEWKESGNCPQCRRDSPDETAGKTISGTKEETNRETDTVTVFAEKTDVTMYPLAEREILEYIDTKEPMDKAGAYAIQGISARFIKSICGDYNNVVGLPIARLWQECFRS
ncbi:MAG: Maf family protein [Lachnospiraceae bacterium]|nr:Maf family protein [Lachnospiraceae bacterium]